MTDKTRNIFEFIVRYKQAHDGNSPSVREIQDACGISTPSLVHYHLGELETVGWIELTRFQSRSIQVEGGRWSPGKMVAERLARVRSEGWTL
ncbi:MAG: LexA family protein [Planctomycetota bacterium]|jgi:repressor LexA